MKLKTWWPLFLIAFSLTAESKQLNVEIGSKSAILINAETGAILYEKNAHEPCYPASITKIATALYALEKKSHCLHEMVTPNVECLGVATAYQKQKFPSQHPSHRLEPDGTSMGIKFQEVLSLKDLLYGLMLSSGNDAANAIAHYVSGSIPQFMEELNEYLAKRNIKNTFFNNPHGLHHHEHLTTAHDMAYIAREAMKSPLFREIVKTLRYERPETNKQPAAYLFQHNQLLKKGPYFYPKAIGIKTGYHSKSGYTIVAAAEGEDRTLIAVVLNAPDLKQRYRDTISLFETAFSEKKVKRLLFSQEHEQFFYPLKDARKPVIGILEEDFYIEYFPSEEPVFRSFLKWTCPVGPVAQGDIVGEVQLLDKNGETLRKATLFAREDVEMNFLFNVKKAAREAKLKLHGFRHHFLLIFGVLSLVFLFFFMKRSIKFQKGR